MRAGPRGAGFGPGRIEQAADFPHALQYPRRHPAHDRGVHGKHVMTLHRAKARVLAPFQDLPRALGTGGGDEYDIGVAREHRFLVDRGRQCRQSGENIVAAAQRQDFVDHLAARQGIQRPVPHLIEHLEPRPCGVSLAQLREFGPVSACSLGRRGFGSRQAAEFEQRRSDVVEAVLFGDIEP